MTKKKATAKKAAPKKSAVKKETPAVDELSLHPGDTANINYITAAAAARGLTLPFSLQDLSSEEISTLQAEVAGGNFDSLK